MSRKRPLSVPVSWIRARQKQFAVKIPEFRFGHVSSVLRRLIKHLMSGDCSTDVADEICIQNRIDDRYHFNIILGFLLEGRQFQKHEMEVAYTCVTLSRSPFWPSRVAQLISIQRLGRTQMIICSQPTRFSTFDKIVLSRDIPLQTAVRCESLQGRSLQPTWEVASPARETSASGNCECKEIQDVAKCRTITFSEETVFPNMSLYRRIWSVELWCVVLQSYSLRSGSR